MRFKEFAGIALTLALTAYGHGQPQPNTLPTQPGVVPFTTAPPLYRMDDVSRSMNLTPQQLDRLNQLTDKTQAAYRERYDQLSGVPPQERAVRTRELNQRYQADWMRGARDILNENQLSRYQQLNYQYGGLHSLQDADLQSRLNLTPEQRSALGREVDWRTQQLDTINRLAPDQRTNAFRTFQTQEQQRFSQFLTPDQMRTWREATGEPHAFTPGR